MADTAEVASGLTVGDGIFYMKVGTHAGDTIHEIVDRKQADIARHGYTLWGYGGGNCHPLSIVQPFAEELQPGSRFWLMMEETHAQHFAVGRVADQYSTDGINWKAIPEGMEVKGSRYALVITDLAWAELSLPLPQTEVVVGPHSGRRGNAYVKGIVDKACLKFTGVDAPELEADNRPITLVASIREPFAVFLRERPEVGELDQ